MNVYTAPPAQGAIPFVCLSGWGLGGEALPWGAFSFKPLEGLLNKVVFG